MTATTWVTTAAYTMNFKATMRKPTVYDVDGLYRIPTQYNRVLEENGLVEHLGSVPDFLLTVCNLLDRFEQEDNQDAFAAIEKMISHAIIYHNYRWYYEMVSEHLSEIPYRLWVLFNFCGDWFTATGPSFRDMPTAMFERFISDPAVRGKRFATVPVKDMGEYLRQRDDVYALSDSHIRDLIYR